MAEAAHDDYHHGDQDITAQRSTYHSIMTLFKYAMIGIGIVLILLAMTRTNAVDCKKADQAAAHLNDCGKLHAGQAAGK